MIFTTHFRRLIQAMVAGVALAAAVPAQAQFGEAAGIAEAMQQDYLRRDIVLFSEGLTLDDTQRSIVEALYGDYEQAFEDGLAKMRKRIEDMREELQATDVDRVLRIVFKPIEDWSTDKRKLGDTFLANVKVVLTPEQQENWPKFERFLFREKNLSKGRLSGESLNLFYIVRDMKLTAPETEHIQGVLDEYDVSLDTALRNRQQAVIGSQGDMLKSFSEQNPAVSLAILQRQIGMSIAVRSVNDEFIGRLAEVMPSDRKDEFRQKALERAYPHVYRPTPVQNIFKAAKELEGLSGETLGAITSLEAAYVSELRAINQQLAETSRNWEPQEQRLRAEAFAKRMSGAQPDQIEDPTREMFMRRDEISHSYTRQLRGLLTDEQFGQLPGGYRWADLPGQTKPGVPEAMPTGEGGKRPARPGAKGEGENPDSGEGAASTGPTKPGRP